MMQWKITLAIVLGLAVLIAVALIYGAARWQASTDAMHATLEGARRPIEPKTYSTYELIGLPAPVQRYFRAVLTEGQPLVVAVSVDHVGAFNMGATGDQDQWKSFSSTQRVITQRPGFDWEARIEILPGIPVRVHDAYLAGEGMLHAAVFGLVPVADVAGTPDAAQGELLRFFAETAWYPTALLPSQGVQWVAVDDHSAIASMRDGNTNATLLFRFNANGLIDSMRAEARGAMINGVIIPTPWEGHWSNYELHNGMHVPMVGEVAWIFPTGPKPYWRGTITSIVYTFTQ